MKDAGVDVSTAKIVVNLVKQMYHSGQFNEVDMTNRDIDMVPTMKETLISVGKLSDAGYISVLDNKEVNIYD